MGFEQSFLDFLHLLKFDEQLTDDEISLISDTPRSVRFEQVMERFLVSNNPQVQWTNNNRTCENMNGAWHCIFGTLDYSGGTHRIRVKVEKSNTDVLIGICSRLRPPTGPFFYNKPSTCGWFTHRHVITHGQGTSIGWPQVNENDTLELTINCDDKSVSVVNEKNRAKNNIHVNIYQAPFPWCLLLIFRPIGSRVSLI